MREDREREPSVKGVDRGASNWGGKRRDRFSKDRQNQKTAKSNPVAPPTLAAVTQAKDNNKGRQDVDAKRDGPRRGGTQEAPERPRPKGPFNDGLKRGQVHKLVTQGRCFFCFEKVADCREQNKGKCKFYGQSRPWNE